jgi:hypothetical protein
VSSRAGGWKERAGRLLREPAVIFFAAGALLFVAHRAFVGAPRTVVVTAAVKAELARQFQETNGRPPTAAERAADIQKWKTDEVLFREALREHLDRDDPGIRAILADKMRMRAAFEAPKREPTDAELDAWLAAHRSEYQTPPRYDFEFIAFPKTDPRAQTERDDFDRAITQGKNPAGLGRPVIGGNLIADDMKGRVEPELAARIPGLQPGAWQRLETHQSFVLARVKSTDTGVPTREKVGAQLIADWKRAAQKEAVDRVLQPRVDRYRFEEEPQP